MIGATYPVLASCTGSDQSLSRSLSPVDRVRCREFLRHPSAPVIFTLEARSLHLPTCQFSALAFGTVSRKKPFNTQRLVPAPFNEFYPKCSGPTIPLHHAIPSAGALPIESVSLSASEIFKNPFNRPEVSFRHCRLRPIKRL